MDIRNPEYILEIARQRSVTRAAEQLFVTQSTLSQYLLKLEGELGTPLFTRTKNELIPTEAGQMYLQAAQAVVQIQYMLAESIATLKNEGCIRLGVSSQWGIQMATELLPAFKEHFPTITIKIFKSHSLQLRSMLMTDKLDLAALAAADSQDLHPLPFVPLRREELVLILPQGHPYCALHPEAASLPRTELRERLRTVSYIFSDEGSTVRQVEDALFQKLLFRPNIVCELNSNQATLEMVSRGVGAALVPRDYAHGVKGVRSFRLEEPVFRSNLLAYRRNLEKIPPLQLLERLIRAYPLFEP